MVDPVVDEWQGAVLLPGLLQLIPLLLLGHHLETSLIVFKL